MKKILLFIVALVSLNIHAQIQRVANFDFTTESFWKSNLSNYDSPESTNYSFASFSGFSEGLLSFAFTKAAAGYNKDNNEYLLNLQQGATMTISVSSGSVINSIEFADNTVEVDLQLAPGEAGSYDHSTKKWTSSGAISSVKFSNFTSSSYVWKMKVTYTEPSVVLSAYASPSASETPVSFSSLILTYPNASGNMSVQSTSGITIQGNYDDTSKGSVNSTMSASASGNKVTLSVSPAIVSDGTFTITIPARAFKDGAGYENEAMTTKVTVRENRAIFNPIEVTPAEGNITELPEAIKLKFDNDVTLGDIGSSDIVIKKDGTPKYTASLAIDETDQKTVLVKSSHAGNIANDEANLGTWTIDIPAGAVHNPFKGNAIYDFWNKDLTLTYTLIETPDPLKPKKTEMGTLKTQATELIAKIGTVGYPKADDATPTLASANIEIPTTEAELDAAILNLQNAIKAFYNNSVVALPASQKWYTIASVNKDGAELPLSYSNGAVSLGGTATAFQVESITSEGIAVLKVKAGKDGENTVYKYLHVLLGADDYNATSSKNVTDAATFVSNLTIGKMTLAGDDVDQKPVAGLLTIKGCVGNDKISGDKLGEAFAQVTHGTSPTITTSLTETTLYFESGKTNAFRFIETTEPSDETVTPTPTPTPSPTGINPTATLTEVNTTNNTMTLTIGEVTKVTLKDASLVKVLQDGTRDMSLSLTAPTLIEAVEGSDIQFTIHVDGLPVGNYTLSLPVGSFQYYDEGVNEAALAPTFSITNGGTTPDPTPTPTPDPTPTPGTGNFEYSYKSGIYPETVYGMYHTDVSLNDFSIYTNMYTDLVADSRRVVKLTDKDNIEHVYRTGTLVEYTAEDYAKHPEWPAGTKALKLVMNAPINKGDLAPGEYAFIIEAATFGDGNFRQWLGNSSFTGKCIVNGRFAYDYIINNDAADANSTFTSYQTEQIAVVEGKAKEGDSQACADLIATAKSEIGFLRYDPEMTLAQNKARVDAIVSKLDSDLAAQRTSDANDAAFITYKSEQKTAVDGKTKEGDSEECKALITAAKAAIDALAFDKAKSLAENKALVDAIISKLDADLATQRAYDASKAALSKSVADATAYYESIKESHAAIASSLNSAIEAAKTILSNASSAKSVLDSTKQILDAALQNAKNAVTTGITTISADDDAFNGVNIFTIDGRKLDGKPTKKGVYIVNGRKVVIK